MMRAFVFLLSLLASVHAKAAAQPADRMLQDVQGHTIPMSSLKGKWVIIHYWASWCQPCLEEISTWNQFYRDNQTNSIAVFAVNYDGLPLEKQRALIKQYHIESPSLNSNTGDALHLGNISAVPVVFVFNPNGQLSKTLYGAQRIEELHDITTRSRGKVV